MSDIILDRYFYKDAWNSSGTYYQDCFEFLTRVELNSQDAKAMTSNITVSGWVRTKVSGWTYNVNNVWTSLWLKNNTTGADLTQIAGGDMSTLSEAFKWYTPMTWTGDVQMVRNGKYAEANITIRYGWNNTSGLRLACPSFTEDTDLALPELEVSIRVPISINGELKYSIAYVKVGDNLFETRPHIKLNNALKEVISS